MLDGFGHGVGTPTCGAHCINGWLGTNLDAFPLGLGLASGPYEVAAAVHSLARSTSAARPPPANLNTL